MPLVAGRANASAPKSAATRKKNGSGGGILRAYFEGKSLPCELEVVLLLSRNVAELQWRFVPSAASALITEYWHSSLSGFVTESKSGETNTRLAFSQVKVSGREGHDSMLKPFRREMRD